MSFGKWFLRIYFIATVLGLTFLLITGCDKEEELRRLKNPYLNEDSLNIHNLYHPTLSDSILVGDSILYPLIFETENPDKKSPFHPSPVRLSSADDSIATINHEGWIKGKKRGETTITATINGKITNSILLRVLGKDDVKSIAVSLLTAELEEGHSMELQLIANTFGDSSFTLQEEIDWKTDSPDIAVVDTDGVVTGVNYGEVIISAFYNSLKSSISLKVLNVADWSNRDSMGELIFGNKMWILGGYGDNGVFKNDVWSSENGLDWIEVIPEAPWSRRNLMGAVVFKNKMWILGGGHALISEEYNDIWYSENGSDWILATDNPPWAERTAFGCVVFQDKVWVMGGLGKNNKHYNDVWSSEDGINWTLVADQAPWEKRSLFDAMVFNGKIWILGGGVYFTETNYNDVWSSDDGLNWTLEVENAPWEARRFYSTNIFDNKIWIVGGIYKNTNDHNLNDVGSSGDGIIWTQVTKNADWSNRHEAGLMVYHDKMWILGGIGLGSAIFRDIWYSADGKYWRR